MITRREHVGFAIETSGAVRVIAEPIEEELEAPMELAISYTAGVFT